MVRILFCFFMCLCFMQSDLLQSSELQLDQIMTQDELDQTGVAKLTPEQKEALQRWLDSWTKKAISQAASYRVGENLNSWIKLWPKYLQPNLPMTEEERVAEQKKLNLKVFRIYNTGKELELMDGSRWSIATRDQPEVSLWVQGEPVEIKETGARFPKYLITNIPRQEVAGADQMQPPSETGKVTPEPGSFYKGAVRVTAVGWYGDTITLSDGTVWTIKLSEELISQRWHVDDRIRVDTTNEERYYPETLTNLDTGDVVHAKPKTSRK